MPALSPKRRYTFNTMLSEPQANGLETEPSTPTAESPQTPLAPRDTLQLGDYSVSVDTLLTYGLKLEDHFVETYQVTAQRISGSGYKGQKTCTLKRIPYASSTLRGVCEAEERILRELTRSRHHNINPLLDFAVSNCSIPTNPQCWDILYLFSDLEISNLSQIIADHRKARTRMKEDEIIGIAIDLVDTLAFLHDCTPPLLHRNIRPSSIVQTCFNTFKVSGFLTSSFPMGPASSSETGQLVESDIGCYMDPRYCPPEMTERHGYPRRDVVSYTTASDIWCVGILLYIMCHQRHPLEGGTGGVILETSVTQTSWKLYPRVKPVIDKILIREPGARPTAKTLQGSLRNALEHPPYLLEIQQTQPVIFSSKAKELLTTSRESLNLSGNMGDETPFWDPSRSRPLPTELHPTAGSLHKGCFSLQEKDSTPNPDSHTSLLCPPAFSSHNHSQLASPRLVTTGLSQIESHEGNEGLIKDPSSFLSVSSEASSDSNALGLLSSTPSELAGSPSGYCHSHSLQSVEQRHEPPESVPSLTRAGSAGYQSWSNISASEIEEIPYRKHNLAADPAQFQDRSLSEILPVEIDKSKAAETSVPDNEIGYLVTITSPGPLCVEGNFGDILEGTHLTLGRVALKRPRVGNETKDRQDVLRRFEREGLTWRGLNHPHILKFLGTFRRDDHIYFVSPFIDNGNLSNYVRKCPNTHRIRLLCETADAIEYLHKKRIVHGDIKASNILVDSDEHVLLCDFGLAKVFDSETSAAMRGAGTTRWQSPELWNDEPKTFKSDVYAFAMTIVEVLTGDLPFPHIRNANSVIAAVGLRDERPRKQPMAFNGVSYDNAWEVAEACWQKMPRDRITISEAFDRLQKDPSLV